MIIIWGKKLGEKLEGQVADFCPYCREVRAFASFRMQLYSHLYYIPLGSGEYVCHKVICEKCSGQILKEHPPYADRATQRLDSIEDLIANTNSELLPRLAERLALEDKIKNRTLPAELRAQFIAEPFLLMNPLLEKRMKETNFDKHCGIGCFGTFGVTILLILLMSAVPAPYGAYIGDVALGAAVLGIFYTIYQCLGEPSRYLRREIYPAIARCILPLEPSREEVQAVVSELVARGANGLSKIRVDELFATAPKDIP